HGTSVNARHLNFSRKNLRKATQGRPQFLQKYVPPKCSLPLECIVTDLNRRTRAHHSGFDRPWRSPREIRQKNILDRSHILRRLQQARTPLRKDGFDLARVCFSDKIVEASLRFEE